MDFLKKYGVAIPLEVYPRVSGDGEGFNSFLTQELQ